MDLMVEEKDADRELFVFVGDDMTVARESADYQGAFGCEEIAIDLVFHLLRETEEGRFRHGQYGDFDEVLVDCRS